MSQTASTGESSLISNLTCKPSGRKRSENESQVGSRPRTSVPIDVNVTTPLYGMALAYSVLSPTVVAAFHDEMREALGGDFAEVAGEQ